MEQFLNELQKIIQQLNVLYYKTTKKEQDKKKEREHNASKIFEWFTPYNNPLGLTEQQERKLQHKNPNFFKDIPNLIDENINPTTFTTQQDNTFKDHNKLEPVAQKQTNLHIENLINKNTSIESAKNEEENTMPPKYEDGSFRTRKNELLEYRFLHNNKRISVYGRSKQECFNKRTDIIAGKETAPRPIKKLTYEKWIYKWFKLYKEPYNGERSLKSIMSIIKNYITPALGKHPLDELKQSQLQSFINKYADRPNSQKKISDILYASLQSAYEDELINRNPYVKKRLAAYTKKHYRALEFDEQIAVYNESKGEYRQLFFFACCTGIRIGRILELEAKDINEAKQEITVFKKQQLGKTETYTVPYLKELIPIPPNGKLFPQLTYDQVLDYFQAIYKRLNIKEANLHSFRHTFISVLAHLRVRDKQIQVWAGHNTLAMTTDTYTHLLESKAESPILEYLRKLKEEKAL